MLHRVIKAFWYWKRDRLVSGIDQWNKIENPEIVPHRYAIMSFDKDEKAIQWRNDSTFSEECWNNWPSVDRKKKKKRKKRIFD